MSKLKLMVIGNARHGKDTTCEYLRDKYDYSFVSSSEFCAERVVFPKMRNFYFTAKACFEDRHNCRSLWFSLIRDYNYEDLTKLARNIFAENDIYCGIRNYDEYIAASDQKLFDLAIWVDASERVRPEDSSSMSIPIKSADVVIKNNGTVEELHQKLDALMASHFFPSET